LADDLATASASGEGAADDIASLQAQLQAALAANATEQRERIEAMSLAEQRAALLAQANAVLSEQEAASAESQRQTALLNQQVAALRQQLGTLQSLLNDAKAGQTASDVEIENLGEQLNIALAQVAEEKSRRLALEEAETARLEAERARLAEQNAALETEAEALARYRSEFFGRLRDVLGNTEGVRIAGDRFVFASEVLFAPGQASLSPEGQSEVAKVADILRSVANDIPSEIDWIIRIDGHTDNQPLSGQGAFADNWELSQARALSVLRYMVSGLDIPPERVSANGFGEFQPIARGNSAAARAQNRRIELKFTEK